MRKLVVLCAMILCFVSKVWTQRAYKPASVLAGGTFYKIAVSEPGVYRIDLAFLRRLGINTSSIPSSAIQIFGNGGAMLPESNNSSYVDDLAENPLLVVDGGDNILNGSDYILFYAAGPNRWLPDSANRQFIHQTNLYSDRAYYFLTIGNNGKRVAEAVSAGNPSITVNNFSGRYFHELDSINFLNSGKEWFGEEFSNLPGRFLSRSFAVQMPGIIPGSTLTIRTHCIARSSGNGSNFELRVNNVPAGNIIVPAIGSGPYDLYAREALQTFDIPAPANEPVIQYTYTPGSFNAQGWLNWFEVFSRQQLAFPATGALHFRDWLSVGNDVARFTIANANSTTRVWDITDPLSPSQMQVNLTGTTLEFVNDARQLREYIAFRENDILVPEIVGPVANQNLHASSPVDHIIITHRDFAGEAQRLVQFHQQRSGIRSMLVTTDQIFNEFSSGSPDPVAIRDFVKMYHDRYAADSASRLRYLLLLGDASFDYRDRLIDNTQFVPAYQNNIALDPLNTYTTDDFFGFLDDHEDINSGVVLNDLDIGIGRVPARNLVEVKNFIDKVEAYHNPASFGPWRNTLSFVADDEDLNLHLQDAEIVTNAVKEVAPVFDIHKIYLDAFRQESGSNGTSYPAANQASNNQMLNGTLIWNFNGHGSPTRLAEETILDQQAVDSWKNANRLPLFITATCDFAPYDNPRIHSLGENILLRPKTGAIALMTTTRTVFAFSNRVMNENYLRIALERLPNGEYRRLGDAVKDAKNYTYQYSPDITNNRKFTLLGDPGLRLAFPSLQVKATSINGNPTGQTDTLQAGEKVTVSGEVTDKSGQLKNDFNGYVYSTVFDKQQPVQTLANDPGSMVTSFNKQNNILFKGKATVTAGKFSFSFMVPRDINYRLDNGKLSLYAENGSEDGSGFYTGFLVGGSSQDSSDDRQGPDIRAFLNDENFVNGGTTNQTPVLILKLSDSSGINTTGRGIGHDIIATLDDDNDQFFVLNDYYQAALDSYQEGELRFQLPHLEPGRHTLKVKAWDVLNNSNEILLEFIVASDESLVLSHVLNYPNPFTTRTWFWFEHNKPGQDLQVSLQIFTVTGRVIKTFQTTINTPGNRSSELEWDGRDQFGARVGRGVYFYKLSVIAPGRQRKEKIEKLVLF